jgi:hypothetical protein
LASIWFAPISLATKERWSAWIAAIPHMAGFVMLQYFIIDYGSMILAALLLGHFIVERAI